MALKDRIEADFKAALKSKDAVKTSCLRMIKAAISSKELTLPSGKTADDALIVSVLNSLTKKAMESIDAFEKGGRSELAEKEKSELAILKSYLPAQLSADELEKLVSETISEQNASGPKDMGKVMKALTPKVAGRADGKLLSTLVQNKLKSI